MAIDSSSEELKKMRLASTQDLLTSWSEYVPDEGQEQAYRTVTTVLCERRLHQNGLELMHPAEGWLCACGTINGHKVARCTSCGLVLSSQLKPVFWAGSVVDSDLAATAGYQTPMTFAHIAFSFRGRISRSTFWSAYFVLSCVVTMSYGLVGAIDQSNHDASTPAVIPVMLATPAFVWSALAIQAKRWHDMGKSGFWTLLNTVPIVGSLLVLCFLGFGPGDKFVNRYGANPRGPLR